MKSFDSTEIRNVGIIGHKAAGKTSLAEAALWSAKVTPRLGSTAQGTSVLDFEPEEQRRVMSSSTAICAVPWKGKKINVLDTPGDGNFLADTRTCLEAADGAICVVSAKDGAEPMTERVYGWAAEAGLRLAFFISKMDLENADFEAAYRSIRANLCTAAALVQLPISSEAHGQSRGDRGAFAGLVDLLTERAYLFEAGDSGACREAPIPATMREAVAEARGKLIEEIATADDVLMEKYFEGSLEPDEIIAGLAKAMAEGSIVPVFCGSGVHNLGVGFLLDFIVGAFPDPTRRRPWRGRLQEVVSERPASPEQPLSALVFKTIVDQHSGKISVMRVLAGVAHGDVTLKNPRTGTTERLGALNAVLGKRLEIMERAAPGDICAVAKLKDTHTLDTLSADGWRAETVALPSPLVSRALHARDKGAEDKIASALQRITEEDPGLAVSRHEQTGELLLWGAGQQHIEVAIEKMQRKFGVACDTSLPKIPYLETFTAPVKSVEGKHKKQSGGHGQFAVCYLDFEPLPRGQGFVFEDAIVGGAVPRQFIPSVEKGCIKAMQRGVIAGHPVVDVKVRLVDGKYHAVDSSDMAFQVAASKAFKAAALKARPVVLEPVMELEIYVPEESMGDVMGDVNTRRGRLHGTDTEGRRATIRAQMPLSEVQQYETVLRSMTQGRGSFTLTYSHMEIVPPHIQERIVKEAAFVVTEEDE